MAGYLLIALIFAEIYRFIEMLSPRSFTLSPVLAEDPEILYAQMVYYSFRTQTTMGGDLLALGAIARIFVIFQALIGQLFPVVILGWLISQEVANRPRKTEESQ